MGGVEYVGMKRSLLGGYQIGLVIRKQGGRSVYHAGG